MATGPTLNPYYNNLLVSWEKQGFDATPECEECSCNLTGKNVHDVGTGWLCTDCMEKDYDFDDEDSEEEYSFRVGRRNWEKDNASKNRASSRTRSSE